MNRNVKSLGLIALLLVVACGPVSPAPANAPSPTPLPAPVELPAGPTSAIEHSPLATPSPVPTVQPATPSSATGPSPLATPTSGGGAGNADVTHVRAVQAEDGTWTFHVTVQHPDRGWQDYADGWDVVIPDGTVLKPDPGQAFTRTLLHPHVDEQPFTRSQSGIAIPPDVTQVRVRGHDLLDGYGGREVIVDLTLPSGDDFEVERYR